MKACRLFKPAGNPCSQLFFSTFESEFFSFDFFSSLLLFLREGSKEERENEIVSK